MEERTLGVALDWMHYLNDGVLRKAIWKGGVYKIKIEDGNGSSSQRYNHILIRRKGESANGLSVAQHVHEIGHLIGNNGVYSKYRKHIKGYKFCHISNYALSKFNEQFAEVFTAFVTEPDSLLKSKRTPRACKRAFDFFVDWFDAGKRAYDCKH